ncbi:hypothetical protein SteCoe_29112 [Stentor coeruleus]|uniref:Aminoglycoside phosphotransferase domain-containing protein n=1 Tax=Stentor coeruleus TaxID=5963 RepID=A0A1R2B6M0_9CILI|nr:hypothetical protein SteCoe_29112 [Stentor coeruleus]
MSSDTENEIINRLKQSISSFNEIPNNSIHLTHLISGTNQIYKISSSCQNSPIIYREFGINNFISKEVERNNFLLVSSSGQGPRAFFQSEDFRIEEYLGESLTRENCNSCAEEIIPSLISYHNLHKGFAPNSIFEYIHNWTEAFFLKSTKYKNNLSELETVLLKNVKKSIKTFRDEVFDLLPKCDEYIFSHNDFSYGNIIVGENKYWIIDYEYSGLGHPSVDLASFIIETQFDFSTPKYKYIPEDEMPIETQLKFVNRYADMARIDSDELWYDVNRSKAGLCYLGMIWAACQYQPGCADMLEYSLMRKELFLRYKREV